MRVLLVCSPYGALSRPALGVSLLKAVLHASGVGCDVRYLTFAFADLVGHDTYEWVASRIPYTAYAGEWTFAAELYGARPRADARYAAEILRATWCLGEHDVARLERVRSLARPFLQHCLAAVPWGDYDLVGFTSTFEQNIASLALARLVKRGWPGVPVVFGGANWEGEMGVELHRRFRFVDYVCSGEAENSLPALVECVGAGQAPDAVPGIVFRRGGESVPTGPPDLVTDLDGLPTPDFSDYFDALERRGSGANVVPTLLVETSRGCWWGAKRQCGFCGLNGQGIAFRRKTARRALDDIDALRERWNIEFVEATDNILDMRAFDDLLPALAASPRRLQMFFEVKANLTRAQVEVLARAGVRRIQPGIESFSNHVLALMRKGTDALTNIQLLKWCREHGVHADWNLLYGVPGETREDYDRILDWLPAIRFLDPPAAWGPIRLDRFSPYFNDPSRHGFARLRPLRSYRHLYPFPDASLARLAYYFEYDYAPGMEADGHAADVVEYLERWKREPEPGVPSAGIRADGALQLHDTRSDAVVRSMALAGDERAVYEYCDRARPFDAIVRRLSEPPTTAVGGRGTFGAHRGRAGSGHGAGSGGDGVDEAALRRFLHALVAARLMVADGDRYLSLAIWQPPLVSTVFAGAPPVAALSQ